MVSENPLLRWPLKIDKIEHESVLMITCPLELTSQPLILNLQLIPMLRLLDGSSTVYELQLKSGIPVADWQVLIKLLDEYYLLDNSNFREALNSRRQQYLDLKIRNSRLAGSVYPNEVSALISTINNFLNFDSFSDNKSFSSSNLQGLIAPHIDYNRGGTVYGSVYKLVQKNIWDVVVLMGTSHQYGERLFVVTPKDFSTPLGLVVNKKDAINRIISSSSLFDYLEEELRHRDEHSIELQLPFLQHSLGNFKILPVLVGSFHNILQSGKYPEENSEYQEFIGALTEEIKTLTKDGNRVGFVASVDMAHVGPYFGDPEPVSEKKLLEIYRDDEAYIRSIIQLNRKALWQNIHKDNDSRRVCGYPTIYFLIDLLDRLSLSSKITFIDYKQALDEPNRRCLVSMSSMVISQDSRAINI